MRQIKRIFVHCTAGSQKQTIDDLKAEFRRKGGRILVITMSSPQMAVPTSFSPSRR